MEKIKYYFRKNNLKINFIEKREKIGINKHNKINGKINLFNFYKISTYTLAVKVDGRPQFILFDKDYNMIINEFSQNSFLSKITPYFSEIKSESYLINKFFSNLRKNKNITQKNLAFGIKKSLITIRSYENNKLNINLKTLESLLIFFNLTVKKYELEFDKFLKENNSSLTFYDFSLNNLLLENKKLMHIDDLISIKEVALKYNIKLSLAYRYGKIANNEMNEDFKVIPGKVSLKKFNEIYWRFNYER